MTATIILSKQIHPNQCQQLAASGVKSLVNLRFDGECQNQPTSDAIHSAATAYGLHYVHLPYQDTLSTAQVCTFSQALHRLPSPILIFCATGGRAKRIYQSAKLLDLL